MVQQQFVMTHYLARTLKNNALRTTNSSGVIKVSHPNHGMHGASNNVTIAGVPTGTYNGIAHSDINGTYKSISNITLDSYDITTTGTATATGDIGGDVITATQNRLVRCFEFKHSNYDCSRYKHYLQH